MKTQTEYASPYKHWSAWLPPAMSVAALMMVLIHVAVFGVVHDPDEGTLAHIFQILLVGQLPIVVYFGIRWLPNHHREGTIMISKFILAALAAVAAVFWLT